MHPIQIIRRLLCAAVIPSLFILSITADNTLRGHRLRLSPKALTPSEVPLVPSANDTLRTPCPDSIIIAGYDKPLNASAETLLLTNLTRRPLRNLSITISYSDMNGRQLHERTDTIAVAVPPDETRMIRLSTWDTQRSYYYHKGKQPRTPHVTPYSVKATVRFVTFEPAASADTLSL